MSPGRRRMTSTRLATLVACAAFLIACQTAGVQLPSTAQRPNERLQAIVAAAATEGELTLSWSAGAIDSVDELGQQLDAFNRRYGLSVRARFAATAPGTDPVGELLQQQRAGQPASSDIVLGTEIQVAALAKAAALIAEPWISWASNIKDLKLVAAGGIAVSVQTRMPGITYNSRKLTGADVPRTLADLLKPQYKGRIATVADGATFDRLGNQEVWGSERTLDYIRKLAGQVGGSLRCGDESAIVNGTYDVLVFDCGGARVSRLKAQGVLIGWTVPADAALVRHLYMGVPKNAAHPNLARLWIDFQLSREAQDLLYQYDFADEHRVIGSRTFIEIDRATKAGVKFYELTVEMIQVEEATAVKPLAPQIQQILRDAITARR
jgi:ABC-type Fe3+ transport system substrate-binding protein